MSEKKSLEELQERRKARVKAEEERQRGFEVHELELEEELSTKHGRRGVDFEIVRTDVGCFAVKRPDFVVSKAFLATDENKRTIEDVMKFVDPCVLYPTREVFRTTCQEFAGVANRLANACLLMHGGNALQVSGKF
jgi:hypothetical protein